METSDIALRPPQLDAGEADPVLSLGLAVFGRSIRAEVASGGGGRLLKLVPEPLAEGGAGSVRADIAGAAEGGPGKDLEPEERAPGSSLFDLRWLPLASTACLSAA